MNNQNNKQPKRKRPGIIINPPTQSTLDLSPGYNEEVIYDEEFDPNKSYSSTSSQYWQNQSSLHRSHDGNSVEIPELPQIRDRSPERSPPRSNKKLHIQTSKDILNVLHLSGPSSPRLTHSHPSTPNLRNALSDDDFEQLREGINFALGTKENDANWFPVSTPTKPKTPVGDHSIEDTSYFADYTTDIPLEDLPPKRPILHRFKSESSIKSKSSAMSPFDTKLDPKTPVDPNHLEAGSFISSQSKDGTSSPRFANAIARISDRIAGSNSNVARKNLSTDKLTVNESQASLPLATPISGHFTFTTESNHSPSKSISKSVPDVTITDDLGQTRSNELVEGLGLYTNESTKSQNEMINETITSTPLLEQLKSSVKRDKSKKKEPVYQDFETMYLFGNSLGVFSPQSKIRQLCYKITEHKSTNTALLIILLLQTALLTYRQWNPPKLGGYFYDGYNWADYILIFINIIYTFEIFGKIIAYGFYDDRAMFEELSLPYPENEIKSQYFNQNIIKKLLNYTGLWKRKQHKKTSQNEAVSENFSKDNLSDDTEIREINLNDSSDNLSHGEGHRFDLHHKYKKFHSHHHHDQYVPLNNHLGDPDDLDTTTEAPRQKLESKNTFFKPTQLTFDKLRIKRAFIRSSWQRIDFISMFFFWISLFLSIGRYDAKHHIMIFRSISCLRILRLCNLTTGTTTILTACKTAIPQLIDVSIFIACFWLFFGIIGVQTFKSSLTRHCVWTNPNDPNETFINSDSYCGSSIGLDGSAQAYIMRDGSSSGVIKGFRCPKYSQCVSGENPYNGTLSFDNIFQSLEIVFVIMSANTFTDIMYYTMDTDNMAACLFFIGCIFVMTVWLLNVFIAIIVASFNITRMEVAEERKKKKQGRHIFKVFGYADEDLTMHEERIAFLKKQNSFLKWYYNLEFIFVLLIFIDLMAQCFRRYDMSSERRHKLYRFEAAFTGIFMAEIVFRFGIYFPNWRLFFTSKRNCFDLFLAVVTTVIIIGPVKEHLGQAYYWLTVFQVMRAYRIVLSTSITRNLWLKIMGNFKAIIDLTLFFFILLFLVGIIIARFFEGTISVDEYDDVEYPMSTLPGVLVALYVITSTENWTTALYAVQEYATTTSSRSFGSVLLIAWFILSNMIILNIFIAVIAKTLEVSEEEKRKQQLLQFIDTMTNKLQHIEHDSGLLAKIKKKIFRKKQVKDELEQAVVNLLLSGTAVNDFLEPDARRELDEEDDTVKLLPASGWKRWLSVNYWRTRSSFRNPFYDNKTKKTVVSLENFNPANFARTIIKERKNVVTRQNEFLESNPRYNYVFYVIGPHHRLRRFCQKMVKPSYGERIDGVEPYKPVADGMVIIMFIATITLVILACYMTPIYRMKDRGFNWTFWSDYFFVIIFSLEFLIKVIADGFIFTPNAYTRSSWNLIDLVVLISLWIEAIAYLKNDGNLSRIVRGLKALRALRLLTISETAKSNFHNTMIAGFWKIINAGVISLCLLLPFSIWGLNIFNGRLGYCIDGESDLGSCFNEYQNQVFDWNIVSPNVYTNPQLHFDRFATSFATLFEIVSLEGWTDLLANVMKSTGVGTVPQTNATPFNGFFVILFNFVSIVFILTLFVSVIISNYSRTTGRAYMTTDQISWYQVKKILVQVRPSRRKDVENLSFFRRFCYRMTVEKNKVWTTALNIVLFFHTIALLMEYFPSDDEVNEFRTSIYMIASSMFFVNSLMLLIGQGLRTFFHYKWNMFNLLVSWGAFTTTLVSYFVNPYSAFININKLFLVSILFFVIPRSNRLSQLLRFASASLPSLISLIFTWIVVFLVFAIAMNQIFGLTRLGPNTTGNINLRSVPKALILLFRCSFGEGWNYIMEDFTLSTPFCVSEDDLSHNDCGSKQYAYILFIAWNIISMYIFLNMFISLILDSFDYIGHRSHYSQLIQREEVRKFKRTWQKFDPEGTGYIKPIELPKLLHSLQGALSFHFYTGALSIPELCKKWIIRNNPNDPYDVTINYDAIEYTMDKMDIPKIRERRKAYEMFIEEALLTMELNDDPGISFTRILLQLPLYTSFDMGNCFNLIDYLERRLLIQKVVKRLQTKKVYETIATYASRWKYKKDRHLGIKDTNIAFDTQLKRNSYLTNDALLINQGPPTIFVTDENESRHKEDHKKEDENEEATSRGSVIYSDHSGSSGVYYPSSPVVKLSKPYTAKPEHPKLFIEIPSKPSSSLGGGSIAEEDVKVSPFLDSQQVSEHESSQNVSLVDLGSIEEILEQSSWKDAFGDMRSQENKKN
ncbi:CCH1 Calcium-channel protein CCH1 [Candida maltosa Xu316]